MMNFLILSMIIILVNCYIVLFIVGFLIIIIQVIIKEYHLNNCDSVKINVFLNVLQYNIYNSYQHTISC